MRLTAAVRRAVIHRQSPTPTKIRINGPFQITETTVKKSSRQKKPIHLGECSAWSPPEANRSRTGNADSSRQSKPERGIRAIAGVDRRGRRQCREDFGLDRARERRMRWQRPRGKGTRARRRTRKQNPLAASKSLGWDPEMDLKRKGNVEIGECFF